MTKFRGFYAHWPFDADTNMFSVYKSDGSFGSCFSCRAHETPSNIKALGEMGYRALPNGWTGIDIKLALDACARGLK